MNGFELTVTVDGPAAPPVSLSSEMRSI